VCTTLSKVIFVKWLQQQQQQAGLVARQHFLSLAVRMFRYKHNAENLWCDTGGSFSISSVGPLLTFFYVSNDDRNTMDPSAVVHKQERCAQATAPFELEHSGTPMYLFTTPAVREAKQPPPLSTAVTL
jgi:hypothetical protein